MDKQRFQALASTYGSDLRRWPQSERAAATAWWESEREAGDALLAAEADLDDALAAWRPAAADAALRDRILASAPKARPRRSGLGLWLSGAGLAAACAAGIVVGVAASSAVVSDVRADDLLAAMPDEAGSALAPFTVSAVPGRSA